MLRSLLIYLSKAAWARRIVTRWPIAWRVASRFVAGEKLEDAIRAVKELNATGINATLDHLGEHTDSLETAGRATADILEMLDAIHEAGVRSNISIKLTQIGLSIDLDLCRQNMRTILERARDLNIFVRIDMEDSPWVDKTLGIYWAMKEAGFDNVGVVIQAYLYRSEEDVRNLIFDGGRIRLCKGAYKEPAAVAFPKKGDVDANYDRLTRIMLDACQQLDCPRLSPDGVVPPLPALATHDEQRVDYARSYAQKIEYPKAGMEFQMLYGIRRDLQDTLVREGFPVRVYVPYGSEWYPYFTRRLAERPANIWFFVSNLFRR